MHVVRNEPKCKISSSKVYQPGKKKFPKIFFTSIMLFLPEKQEEANLFRKKAWRFWILRCK